MLLITAAAGFVVVPEHAPSVIYDGLHCSHAGARGFTATGGCPVHHGLSRTAYDALRIATWAALILGVLAAAIGLIRMARARPELTADRR